MSIALPEAGIDQGTELRVSRGDDDGDHERFAHYIRKDAVLPGYLNGAMVEALCGKRWIPTRDPERYPVCPECKAIFDGLANPDLIV